MSTPLASDWLMSPPQRRAFWRMWAAAMRHQGWNALPFSAQNGKRHEVLSACGFQSAKDVDPTSGFDRVRARLEELADVVHFERPDAGERRRILWLIGQTTTDLRRSNYSAAALEKILRVRFKIIPGARTLADLETSKLTQLLYTLRGRLKAWRAWCSLVNLYRELLTRLALCLAIPAPALLDASKNAPRTAHANAVRPIFSPNSANVKPLLFVGS
jgi:hypothetical protein